MARMNWKDGWHIDGIIEYYIENGVFIRGFIHCGKLNVRPVYPYVASINGGYDRVYNMKANKTN